MVEVFYDDAKYVKRNRYVSCIFFVKFLSTLPFNILGLLLPEEIHDYPWILYLEAFHHYHTRIFYLLALYRNITQFYCAFVTNGIVQKELLKLETLFDIGLIALYIHEYYSLHNINVFFTSHVAVHILISCFSTYALFTTKTKQKL